MDKQEYALEWLRFAKMDLSSAEFLLQHRPLPIEVICFHCQQAAEKCLKGLIVISGQEDPPKIHDLIELCRICESLAPSSKSILTECNILNRYSVQPRYPKGLDITEEDVRDALKYVKAVLAFTEPLIVRSFS